MRMSNATGNTEGTLMSHPWDSNESKCPINAGGMGTAELSNVLRMFSSASSLKV